MVIYASSPLLVALLLLCLFHHSREQVKNEPQGAEAQAPPAPEKTYAIREFISTGLRKMHASPVQKTAQFMADKLKESLEIEFPGTFYTFLWKLEDANKAPLTQGLGHGEVIKDALKCNTDEVLYSCINEGSATTFSYHESPNLPALYLGVVFYYEAGNPPAISEPEPKLKKIFATIKACMKSVARPLEKNPAAPPLDVTAAAQCIADNLKAPKEDGVGPLQPRALLIVTEDHVSAAPEGRIFSLYIKIRHLVPQADGTFVQATKDVAVWLYI